MKRLAILLFLLCSCAQQPTKPNATVTPSPSPKPTATAKSVPSSSPIPTRPTPNPTPTGTPLPTASPVPSASPAAGLKPLPAGVFALFEVNDTRILNSSLWSSPALNIAARVDWSVVEPTQGSFNWGYLDQIMALAQKNGKQVSIRLVVGGANAPAWLYAAGAAKFTQTSQKGPVTFPAPWDPTFQKCWGELIAAFGSRYDSNANLAYVDMEGPGGAGGEWYVCRGAADMAQVTAAGGIPAWQTAAASIISAYVQAFPTTPLVISTGNVPWPQSPEPMQTAITNAISLYGTHIGFMGCALWLATDNTVAEAMCPQYPSNPTGFQAFLPSKNPSNFAIVIANGKKLGAHFLEMYLDDCSDTNNQTAVAAFTATQSTTSQ